MQNLYESDSDRSSVEYQNQNQKVAVLREMYLEKPGDRYTDDRYTGDRRPCDRHTDDRHTDDRHTDDRHTDDRHPVKNSNQENFTCKICSDNTSKNYLILSCNHIFHIKCLAESHFKDIYDFPVIDSEYFDSRKCPCCTEQIQTEELMFLHGKFLSGTKKLISKHQNSIEHLESQLNQIKNELRTCYDYKHKMEKESEKSKQIVSILTTMM